VNPRLPTKCAIVALLLVTGICLNADEKSRPTAGNRKEKKSMNGTNEISQLEAYVHGESKYHVLPVPAPIAKPTALAFVIRELPRAHSPDPATQLSRLAVFYDLRETDDGFLALLKLGEPEPHDTLRSTAALIAVAWLGDAEQFAKAAAYFSGLARRANLELYRSALLDVAYALGPKLDSAPLRQAIVAAITDLQATQNRLKQQGAGLRQLDSLENRVGRLQEFSRFEITALDKANSLRKTIEALPAPGQIARLAELYLGDVRESTPRISDWAAMKLLRISSRPEIAAEFVTFSERYEKTNPERQNELDALRARALRAADFFGADLLGSQRHWLAAREDPGTDLLALRPNWKYPPPLSH
jgi:hypothetical protein